MKTIYQIAKSELKSLFYSPIAWLVLILFTYQLFSAFTSMLDYYPHAKSMNYIRGYLTLDFFLRGYQAPFPLVKSFLYLYIPLLTMGLMSKEYSSGSIKLLYSSPITSTQIILGKYLSMMLFGTILVSTLVILMILCSFLIHNMDISYVLSGILGIYLLMCAYSAIGLFMSCLTSYQIVAALGTLAVLAFLNFVGTIGQTIDFVREITYWLSISSRVDEATRGMICSEDILYFILVSGLFITLSILKLNFERQSVSITNKVIKYTSVIVIVMLLGYVTSRPSMKFFYDATEHKQRTLTPVSQEILNQLKGDMTITTYVNLVDGNGFIGLPRWRISDRNLFEQYKRFKPEIKMKYVYYYDNVADGNMSRQEMDEAINKTIALEDLNPKKVLTPEQIDELIDLSSEEKRFVRIIEHENGQKAPLRIFTDSRRYPFENEISVALKTMITKKPVVGFLTGHNERSINREGDFNYRTFTTVLPSREALINQGYQPVEISLKNNNKIPDEVDILVIADPRNELSYEEMQEIERFIEKGGNMIIASEPRRHNILNPLISKFGLKFNDGTLVKPEQGYAPDLIFANYAHEGTELSKAFGRMRELGIKIAMPSATGIEVINNTGFKHTPILVTDSQGTWNEMENYNFEAVLPTFNPDAGEVQKSVPTSMAVTRQVGNKEQRIIILGDADCMSNFELNMSRDVRTANFAYMLEMFKWLVYNQFPLDVSRPDPSDNDINITESSAKVIKLILKWIIPGLILVLGILFMLLRRKN